MFLSQAPERPYRDPWLTPLPQRLLQLCRGQRRAAYYYEEPNNSTFRYRSYNMAQVLNAGNGAGTSAYSASWFHRVDLADATEEIATRADLLVVCRSGYESRLARLIKAFQLRGKRVLFDVDDLVFDTRYAHLIMNALDQDVDESRWWDYWFSYLGRMRATLALCDGAITTNTFLAERLGECSGLPVWVVPNFMNAEQFAVSSAALQCKQDSGFARNREFTLGYFSGSPSHNHDYAIVEPAIAALMARRPEVRLLTVGYIAASPRLAPFKERLTHAPFHDWVNLQRLIASVEVNLMPLMPSVFTDCKSPLKYFESAAVGTLSIASPAFNYAANIQPGVTGYLARGHEWEHRIEELMDSMEDYPALAARAQQDAQARFSGPSQRAALLNALGWA